jgi:hypothetical protein
MAKGANSRYYIGAAYLRTWALRLDFRSQPALSYYYIAMKRRTRVWQQAHPRYIQRG